MGLISLPIMLRYGYDRRFASGVIAASGTLAQIIPPSLVLIIMADQLGKSVGDMYAGAFIPGIMLAGLYALYVIGVTIVKPDVGAGAAAGGAHDARAGRHQRHAVAPRAGRDLGRRRRRRFRQAGITRPRRRSTSASWSRRASAPPSRSSPRSSSKRLKLGLLSQLAERVIFVLIPPLALIFLVLGTIFLGVATPTEGGAMGATGALIMALARRRLIVQAADARRWTPRRSSRPSSSSSSSARACSA